MDRLPTRVDLGSDEFASRKSHNTALLEELRAKIEQAKGGGGGKYVERHRQRGKKMARERTVSYTHLTLPTTPYV